MTPIEAVALTAIACCVTLVVVMAWVFDRPMPPQPRRRAEPPTWVHVETKKYNYTYKENENNKQ